MPALPLAIAALPFTMPAVQVSLIWHRQQDGNRGLQWLRRQIVEAAVGLTRGQA